MSIKKQKFSHRYTTLLHTYVMAQEEKCLTDIECLGHEMVQSDITPEEISEMHDTAIGELIASSDIYPEIVRAASLSLSQFLKAYGIAFREVRARYDIEQILIENQKLYRTVVEQINGGIVIVQDAKYVYVNPAIADLWGMPVEDIIGLYYLDLIHPNEYERMAEIHKQRLTGGGPVAPYEVRCVNVNGCTLWVEMRGTLIEYKGRPAALVAVHDITERKEMELAVEKANKETESTKEFLENLIELAQVGIFVHRGREILMVNPYLLKRMGINSQDRVLGKDYLQFVHPDDRQASIQRIQQLVEHGNEYQNAHVRATSLSGESIYFEASSTVFQYESKKTILTILIDATERHKASESERKLSSAIMHAGESVIITDKNGTIEFTNPTFTEITGYSREEAIGKTPRILKSGNQDEAFYADMWKTITAGKAWKGKVIDRKKDGSCYPAMLTITPIFDTSEDPTQYTHFIGIQSDLSQLEDMEHRFHQAQKMEAIGTMVGGIAHNFNNMLAGMTGNLYLAKMKAQGQPDVVEKLANIETLSRHAAEMISQLLAFARKDMVSMKAMSLTPFIKETLKFLHTSVSENIAIHEKICADDLRLNGDATQLHQVLVNLVNNARDALEGADDPHITIRLESFHADDVFIESRPYAETGSYAHLSVADNGIGIPESKIEHLFEPFFTTKEQGKGTGLGLSMVYGALKMHHGFVEVDSVHGKGATFHIYIPLLEKKDMAADEVPNIETVEGLSELILLADDEPMVRDVMAEVLESIGYRVLKAEDGLQAIDQFKAHQQEIALALLDVVMPHLGGMPLARKIRETNPDVPVIFLTGYDQNQVLNGDEPMANSKILTKPVEFNVLSQSIRQLLD